MQRTVDLPKGEEQNERLFPRIAWTKTANLFPRILLNFGQAEVFIHGLLTGDQPNANKQPDHNNYLPSSLAVELFPWGRPPASPEVGEEIKSLRGRIGSTPPLSPVLRMNFSMLGMMRSTLSR